MRLTIPAAFTSSYNLIYLDAAHQPRSLCITIFLPLSANANKHFEFY